MSCTNLFDLSLILLTIFGIMLLVRKVFYNEHPRWVMHRFDMIANFTLLAGVIIGYGAFAWWMLT